MITVGGFQELPKISWLVYSSVHVATLATLFAVVFEAATKKRGHTNNNNFVCTIRWKHVHNFYFVTQTMLNRAVNWQKVEEIQTFATNK